MHLDDIQKITNAQYPDDYEEYGKQAVDINNLAFTMGDPIEGDYSDTDPVDVRVSLNVQLNDRFYLRDIIDYGLI